METVLPIRVMTDDGTVAVRDGVICALFMRQAHAELAEPVAAAYEAFEGVVGAERLQWIHHGGESYRPYTPQMRARVRDVLKRSNAEVRQEERFTIKGDCGESDAGAFLFRYRGRDMKGQLANVNASSVEMWFPTEFGSQLGWSTFAASLLRVSAQLPFSSGYCSLALNREDWAVAATESFVAGKALRHPGLDIHQITNTAIRIGDDVRGAYWLTLLSPQALERLDMTAETLAKTLGPDIQVHRLVNGVAIQAGERPELGDRNRREALPLVRKVAAVVAPIQHVQRVGVFGFLEVEEFVSWQRRHLS